MESIGLRWILQPKSQLTRSFDGFVLIIQTSCKTNSRVVGIWDAMTFICRQRDDMQEWVGYQTVLRPKHAKIWDVEQNSVVDSLSK